MINNNHMKKIYAIELDSDYGILFLNEKFKPLEYIHENDRHHESDFYKSLAKKYKFETIEEYAIDLLNENEYDEMLNSEPDSAEAFCEYLVPKLQEKYKQ